MPRWEIDYQACDLTMLRSWLEWHRETLAIKCSDLSTELLASKSIPPSSLSLLGLLRHMTEIERTFFRVTFAGEDLPALAYGDDPFGEGPDPEFDIAREAPDGTALAAWRAEVIAADAIIATSQGLDDRGASGLPLRFWLFKTLSEYARHCGHADLLRELADGTVGE